MLDYINEIIKTYKALYLINPKYKKLRKEDIDSREMKLKKLSTLNKIYKDELFNEQIKQEQKNLQEEKYTLGVAYRYKLDSAQSFCYRGFSSRQLNQYYIEFAKKIVGTYPCETKVIYKKLK